MAQAARIRTAQVGPIAPTRIRLRMLGGVWDALRTASRNAREREALGRSMHIAAVGRETGARC